jgi:hypothetical protein
LKRFWNSLERHFPIGGTRKVLSEHFDRDLIRILECGGILSYLRVAETYPCPIPGFSMDCPRQVVHLSDGTIRAICGNHPPECEELVLEPKDIEFIGVKPEALCRALREALLIGGKFEKLSDFIHVYRVGTFMPQPGVRHSVFFVSSTSPEKYAVTFDALRSRYEGETFAVLVPTDRFVDSDTIRQMATLGIPIIPLREVIGIDSEGKLTTAEDPIRLFEDIGRRAPKRFVAGGQIVAQVLDNTGWHELDEAGYQRLLEAVGDYEIFADERSKTIWRKVGGRAKRQEGIRASYFRILRAGVEKKGYFDPNIEAPDEEQISGKQIFRSARRAIDIKYKNKDGKATWKLFKSVKVENHTEYQFQPDENLSFALIFLPRA